MAHDSKAKRKLQRLKRDNSLYKRVLLLQAQNVQLTRATQMLQQHSSSIRGILYAILTQRGGSMEAAFTVGTMEQVQASFARLSVEVIPTKDDPTLLTVQLVEAAETQSSEPPPQAETAERTVRTTATAEDTIV